MWHMGGTTPKAQAIGAELRRAREDAGISARQLAQMLGKSHTTIGRWEAGDRGIRPTDVSAVLAALGADNELREELVELARDSNGRHWLAADLPEQQRQLAAILEFERDATRIVNVSQLLIPGLLQTSSYARAIIGAGGVPAEEVETRVAVRVGRREAITRRDPAQMLAVIDESALYRVIGGREVMRDQLRSLQEAAGRPNVDLRVVPMETDWHPALEGPFAMIEFPNRTPVVHIENRRSGQFFHEPDDVDAYRVAVDRVLEMAMSPTTTTGLIAEVIDKMETAP
jgi:transcriptional regulator with XRE-family HTH domain